MVYVRCRGRTDFHEGKDPYEVSVPLTGADWMESDDGVRLVAFPERSKTQWGDRILIFAREYPPELEGPSRSLSPHHSDAT